MECKWQKWVVIMVIKYGFSLMLACVIGCGCNVEIKSQPTKPATVTPSRLQVSDRIDGPGGYDIYIVTDTKTNQEFLVTERGGPTQINPK